MTKKTKPEPATLTRPEKINISYCPECGSDKLKRDWAKEDEHSTIYKTICLNCDWSGDILEVVDWN
jgi:NMD protein affecting ribosome stability and mRNA decay